MGTQDHPHRPVKTGKGRIDALFRRAKLRVAEGHLDDLLFLGDGGEIRHHGALGKILTHILHVRRPSLRHIGQTLAAEDRVSRGHHRPRRQHPGHIIAVQFRRKELFVMTRHKGAVLRHEDEIVDVPAHLAKKRRILPPAGGAKDRPPVQDLPHHFVEHRGHLPRVVQERSVHVAKNQFDHRIILCPPPRFPKRRKDPKGLPPASLRQISFISAPLPSRRGGEKRSNVVA